MIIGIVAAVSGVLIAAAAIIIPYVVRHRNQIDDHDQDSRAYLSATGRSGRDVARGNSALGSGQGDDAVKGQEPA